MRILAQDVAAHNRMKTNPNAASLLPYNPMEEEHDKVAAVSRQQQRIHGASLSNLRPLRPRQLGDIDGDAPRFVVNYQLIT